jgi:Phosphotransferase enzyme family
MKIILDTNNVFEYLAALDYCKITDKDDSKITIISAKNFNLHISFSDNRNLLVKQEIHDSLGNAMGEFWVVWRINKLMKEFSDFGNKIANSLPDLLHFDPENSILIFNYAIDHVDLFDFYVKENQFPVSIAGLIGKLLGTIHSQTFQCIDYKRKLEEYYLDCSEIFTPGIEEHAPLRERKSYSAIDIIERISRITPQIYRTMPQECLHFFRLYQRDSSLSKAIAALKSSITPSCLIHNDLKINNILLNLNWTSSASKVIKLIDWERANWGDPAFDIGCILCSYLEIWLDGLTINSTLSINESLQLATTPLELLQPSLSNLVRSYIEIFPQIMLDRPDYFNRAVQFTGLSLIERIEITIDEERTFGNRGIVMLQVAKQLICSPQTAMNTLFGINFTQEMYG